MDYAISTHLFVNERLSSHTLDKILAAGIRQIEIFAARQHFDYHDENQVRDVALWFRDHQVQLFSLHAPLYSDTEWGRTGPGASISITHVERRRRISSMEEIKKAIDVAELLPFRFLVLHLGHSEEEYSLERFDAAMTSIENLRLHAKPLGLRILLENIPNELTTPERLLNFIQYTRMDDLGVCFDVGHAHLSGGVLEAFEALKTRIVSTHVHDNKGDKDAHLMPFQGSINWQETMRAFRTVEGQFPVLFELRNYGENSSLEHLCDVIRKLDALR